MSEPNDNPSAWNPLTPRGVASFAESPWGRVWLVEFIFGVVLALAVIWFVVVNYSPVVTRIVDQFPDAAEMENGEVKGIDAILEQDGKFLSVSVDPFDIGTSGTGDLQLCFGRTSLSLCSMAGCLEMDYGSEMNLDLSRSSISPWWGARKPFIAGGAGVLVLVGTIILLPVLGLILMWPAKLVAYFADRELSLGGAWKLAIVAQVSGTVVLTAGVLLYGWQMMDLLGLGIFYILHVVVNFVFLLTAPIFLPKMTERVEKANPFEGASK